MTHSDTTPFLLVGNPTSCAGKAARAIEKARHLLDERRVPYEFRSTLPGGATVEMVRAAIDDEGISTVVYMGGDGTFYEVAKGICLSADPRGVKLGMLPSGTANDQGRSFGISSNEKALPENIDILLNGHTTPLDVGRVITYADDGSVADEDLFFDSIGWGLSAAILAFRNRELQLVRNVPIWRDMYHGQAVYVRAAMHELALNWITRDRFAAELTIDGEVHNFERLSDLILSNTVLYAGEWIMDPESKPDDGRFEIDTFSGVRDWTSKLIVHHKHNPLTVEKLEKLGLSHSPVLKGTNIRIQFFRPEVDSRLPAQRDGEEFVQADHVLVEAVPRLLQVIVPENYHWI